MSEKSIAVREDIDWSGIRAAAVVIGVREAARRAACDLPQQEQDRFTERVMKRCSREGWLTKGEYVKASPREVMPLSAPVRTGSDLLLEHLEECDAESKKGYATVSRKLAGHFACMEAEKLIACTPAVKDGVSIADKTFGWTAQREKAQSNPLLLLSITGCPSVTVQGNAPTE